MEENGSRALVGIVRDDVKGTMKEFFNFCNWKICIVRNKIKKKYTKILQTDKNTKFNSVSYVDNIENNNKWIKINLLRIERWEKMKYFESFNEW